jgi:hypothetical protein
LNQGLPKLFDEVSRRGVKISIRHQTGANDLDQVKAQYAELGLTAECFAFIDDMQSAYEWSDLLVCRAGASTVTEVAAAGLAAVFIPLPSAIDDHQTANARYLADQHAAWLVPQSALATNSLADLLQGLSREDLQQVAERAKSLSISNAAQTVAQHRHHGRAARPDRVAVAGPDRPVGVPDPHHRRFLAHEGLDGVGPYDRRYEVDLADFDPDDARHLGSPPAFLSP